MPEEVIGKECHLVYSVLHLRDNDLPHRPPKSANRGRRTNQRCLNGREFKFALNTTYKNNTAKTTQTRMLCYVLNAIRCKHKHTHTYLWKRVSCSGV